MSEQLLPGHKTIKVPGPDHPITIEHNTNRVCGYVASRVVGRYAGRPHPPRGELSGGSLRAPRET